MNSIKYAFTLFLLLSCLCLQAQSQTTNEASLALNNYVKMTNESIHGMLLVHRMLENFNQEVNKYVDLQSNQLNFYGNKDLPKNIFEDPEHWFYPESPVSLHETAIKTSTALSPAAADELNAAVNKMKTCFSKVNAIRFEIDDFISNNDLSLTDNQTSIYLLLEKCVKFYDEFYQIKEDLGRSLDGVYQNEVRVKDSKLNTNIDLLVRIHRISKDILEAMRFAYDDTIPDLNAELAMTIGKAHALSVGNNDYLEALKAADEFMSYTKEYLSRSKFNDKYKLYGRTYFYYNVELASAFNKYGSGLVKHTNEYIRLNNPSRIQLLEQPHYFKVIYPKKKIEVPKNQLVIDNLPTKIKEREIVVRQQKIDVDNPKLLLSIYDHKEEDGDIISLNFNGNWIIKERKIEKRALKILVELNEDGENYIILHAENLGDVPPNTIAIRYHYKGKRQVVVLNSDLNESELIQLNLTK